MIIVVLQILAIHFNRWTGWGWFEFLGETGRHSGSWISPFLDRLQHLLLPTITLTVLGVAVVQPLPAQPDARHAERRLRAHGPRQGSAVSARRCSSTPCARR